MTALSEILLLTLIHDVFPLLILIYLHFSWVRKPILDDVAHLIHCLFSISSLRLIPSCFSFVLRLEVGGSHPTQTAAHTKGPIPQVPLHTKLIS